MDLNKEINVFLAFSLIAFFAFIIGIGLVMDLRSFPQSYASGGIQLMNPNGTPVTGVATPSTGTFFKSGCVAINAKTGGPAGSIYFTGDPINVQFQGFQVGYGPALYPITYRWSGVCTGTGTINRTYPTLGPCNKTLPMTPNSQLETLTLTAGGPDDVTLILYPEWQIYKKYKGISVTASCSIAVNIPKISCTPAAAGLVKGKYRIAYYANVSPTINTNVIKYNWSWQGCSDAECVINLPLMPNGSKPPSSSIPAMSVSLVYNGQTLATANCSKP